MGTQQASAGPFFVAGQQPLSIMLLQLDKPLRRAGGRLKILETGNDEETSKDKSVLVRQGRVNFRSGLPGNIVLEVFYDTLLLFDNVLDDIADGNQAYKLIAFNYWQVPDEFPSHQVHAVFNTIIRCHSYGILRHQFADRCSLG